MKVTGFQSSWNCHIAETQKEIASALSSMCRIETALRLGLSPRSSISCNRSHHCILRQVTIATLAKNKGGKWLVRTPTHLVRSISERKVLHHDDGRRQFAARGERELERLVRLNGFRLAGCHHLGQQLLATFGLRSELRCTMSVFGLNTNNLNSFKIQQFLLLISASWSHTTISNSTSERQSRFHNDTFRLIKSNDFIA